jgi:hypothetical protein
MGADFSTRRFFRHYIRPSILPNLSRTYARSFWKQPSSSGSMSPSRSPRSVTGSNSSQQAFNPNPHGGQKRAAGKVYNPRIYGFKVSERAKSGTRMQWMRLRPESTEDLDEVDWKGRWQMTKRINMTTVLMVKLRKTDGWKTLTLCVTSFFLLYYADN